MKATREQIEELATATALLTAALACGAAGNPRLNENELHAKALLIQNNSATLVAWTRKV